MKRVLVICTGNSCRSQMAEGWIRYYGGNDVEVASAGTEAHGLNPFAVRVMMDAVIDISHHVSKTLEEFAGKEFDYIITVCDDAQEKCPYFPGKAKKIHRSFPDPARAEGTDEEKLKVFSGVRDLIEDFCFDFVNENIRPLIPGDLANFIQPDNRL